MFTFSNSPARISSARKTLTTVFVLSALLLQAQREYRFSHHSMYESAFSAAGADAETSVFDHSVDTSYQMILYPNEARIIDEARNEVHYFRITAEQDSTRYEYDYSLKVNITPPFTTTSIQVTKITDLDYEISFVKKTDKAEIKEKVQICLQESDVDLLNINSYGQNKGEMKLILDRLRKQLPADRKFYIADLAHHSGRNTRHYRRTSIRPVHLTLTVPANVVYKNSFLKNK